jgi:cytosine/creatinine deaminase
LIPHPKQDCILFSAAARHGKPIDLHMDEYLDPTRHRFDLVFERVRRFDMEGRSC